MGATEAPKRVYEPHRVAKEVLVRTLYNLVAYSALTAVFRIALIFGGLTLLVYAKGETACNEKGNFICRASASLGNPEASFFVATGYHSGERGYEVDIERALTEYRYAAEQDVASAQYNLGEMLFSGDGVEQDLFEGLTWFLKAAEAGEPRSMYRVAQLLFNTEEGPTISSKLKIRKRSSFMQMLPKGAMSPRSSLWA
jgi:TPR repeat protein